MSKNNTEQKRRTLLKTISWRAIASTDTLILSFIIVTLIRPDSLGTTSATAGLIATFEIPSKLIFYYLHERVWSHLSYGRPKPPEYQI